MTKSKRTKLIMAYAITFVIIWGFCVGFFYLLNLVIARRFNFPVALSCGFAVALGGTFGPTTASWLSKLRDWVLKQRKA